MNFSARRRLGVILVACVVLAATVSTASALQTGSPLIFTIDPATVRQKDGKEFSRVSATVTLKEPSTAYFVCILRSQDENKVHFPAIIFRKGDLKASAVGTVNWKLVRREIRLRVTAFNADAPDRRLTYTVALAPADNRGLDR